MDDAQRHRHGGDGLLPAAGQVHLLHALVRLLLVGLVDQLVHQQLPLAVLLEDCAGRKPSFLAAKRPVRPYKSAIENRFTIKNIAAYTP